MRMQSLVTLMSLGAVYNFVTYFFYLLTYLLTVSLFLCRGTAKKSHRDIGDLLWRKTGLINMTRSHAYTKRKVMQPTILRWACSGPGRLTITVPRDR